ncbi:unnamed protein product [Pleuronectes platessa]|uniref:Uncharacterized protein n=1 Tax=Pleuronectes platessa TaxID=8262 RepID=A0A9N7VDK8_PLEPL|nr:unnamed protein product [Pleuronectes platessa]
MDADPRQGFLLPNMIPHLYRSQSSEYIRWSRRASKRAHPVRTDPPRARPHNGAEGGLSITTQQQRSSHTIQQFTGHDGEVVRGCGWVGHNPSLALSQEAIRGSLRVLIETPIHIPPGEVTLILEQATQIQEEFPDKTQEVIQELEVILTRILVESILEAIRTRTLLEVIQQQVATQQQVVILTRIQQEIIQVQEDIQQEVVILTRIQEEIIQISIQGLEDTQVEVATQEQVATQQEVATQSEVVIQDKVGVRLPEIQGVTLVVILLVPPTGTPIIRSSVPASVGEAMGKVVMGREGLHSPILYRIWDTSPSQQVLPKKP